MKGKQAIYIKIVFIYTKLKKYTYIECGFWFFETFDKDFLVLKSSSFSIIWQFVGHGGEHFCFGVLWRVMAWGDDDTLWGCDPRVGGELATMNIMFVVAKWRKTVVNKVTCNYKVFTYI